MLNEDVVGHLRHLQAQDGFHHSGSLGQLHAAVQGNSSLIANALDIPIPIPPPIALPMLDSVDSSKIAFDKMTSSTGKGIPSDLMGHVSWGVAGTPFTISPPHVEDLGVAALLVFVTGLRVLYIGRRPQTHGVMGDMSSIRAFGSGWNPENPLGLKWEYVLLDDSAEM